MKTNSPKPFIVVDSISQITRMLQGSKLDPKNLIGIKIHVRRLKEYLNISEQQTMLFAAFFVLQIKQNSIDLSDIVNYLNLEMADLIRLKMDIDILLEKDLIETEFEPRRKKSKKQRFRQSDFIIPFHVAEAIYSNSPIENQTVEKMEDFYKQKIVWGNLNLKASYAIAPEGFIINAPCPMIVPANKYLLGVLNSKLADYYIRGLGVTRNGGYFEYKPMFIEKLPVPICTNMKQTELINLVSKLLNDKLNLELEKSINSFVYKLYKLSEEEIQFIESL